MSDETEFWIADPADINYPLEPTTRLLDLNTMETDCDTGWLTDPSHPVIAHKFEKVGIGAFPTDGDLRATDRHGASQMTFRLYYPQGTTAAAGADLIRTLADALTQSRVIVLQRPGQASPRYYDYDPGQMPQQLVGQANARYWQEVAGVEPEGITVSIDVFPWPRIAPVDLDVVTVDNADRHLTIANPGDLDGDLFLQIEPDGNLCEIDYGLRWFGDLAEFVTLYSAPATDATDAVDSSDAVVTDATGGSAKVITFATEEDLAHRFRDTRTPVDTTALEGKFLVKARLTPTGGATDSEFVVQLRSGFTTDVRAMRSHKRHRLDFRDVPLTKFVEVELGYVRFKRGATKLILDFWAGRRSGDRSLAVDKLILEPADYQHGKVSIFGWVHGGWSRHRYDAEDLDGTGVHKKGTYRLNALNELSRTEPNAGFVRAAGIYAVTLEAVLREPDDPLLSDDPNPVETVLGTFAVMDSTTVSGVIPDTVRKTVNLRTKDDQNQTVVRRTIYYEPTWAEEVALKKFQYRVKQTAATLSGRAIRIRHIREKFMRAITSGYPAVLDSYSRKVYATDSLGGHAFGLHHGNVPLRVPKGESVLILSLGDLPTDPDYENIDKRGPTPRSVLTREAIVSGFVVPRVRV